MIFHVTNIRFDFTTDDDFELTDDEKIDITDEFTNTIWHADDEEDVIEQITNETGWCISAINIVPA